MIANLSPSPSQSLPLHLHWAEERAYRIGNALAKSIFILCSLATLLNLRYTGPVEVTADIILLAGCALSWYLTRRQLPKRHFVWWPLYFGFWIGTMPSTWLSGGLYSPWLGFYAAVMIMIGSVIQTRISPMINLAFNLLVIVGWTIVQHNRPNPNAVSYLYHLPPEFMISAAFIILSGLAYCVHGLLRAERDLSREIERRYSELYETRATLLREETANQAKSAFLANISHELRTPLGAVLGYAGLLQDTGISAADKQHFAQTIERNGKQLARLVDDLLDLSKIEAGRIELERIDCKTSDLIGEVLELMRVSAQKKDIDLQIDFLTPVPEEIRIDPTRFKQVLINILGNAVKFTEQGRIHMTLSYSATTALLVLRVRDTGRGISVDERSKLFKPFSQADASMTRKYGGTGLGLNVSRELMRLLGGDLQLTWSEMGVGSEFTITLPIEVVPDTSLITHFTTSPRTSASAIARPPDFDFHDLRILVVDDSPDNRDLLRHFLTPTGAGIEEAVDGNDCLLKAGNGAFDAILMDIQMPGLDGLQATSLLRQKGFRGPVIAITAHAMKEDRERCIEAGCDNHLAKPLKKQELLRALENACHPQNRDGIQAWL